jgi:hypothetical protein
MEKDAKGSDLMVLLWYFFFKYCVKKAMFNYDS